MIPRDWLAPIASTAALALVAELAYLGYRRLFVRLFDRVRFQLLAASGAAAWFLFVSQLESRLPRLARFVLAALVVLAIDVAWRLFDRVVLGRGAGAARERPLVPKLVRDLLGWIAIATAFALAARLAYGKSLESLLLPTAVVSAVVGFALQDVLKNFFAGMALQAESPFEAGDWLAVDGRFVEVREMTWRSTRLRDSLGVEYAEPNADLAAGRIVNYGSGATPVALGFAVGLPYDLAPETAKRLLVEAARAAPGGASAPAPQALLRGFGESSVDYEVRVWTRDVARLASFRDAVLTRVWYRLEREGVAIPFPTRSIAVERESAAGARRRAVRSARAADLLARIDLFRGLDAGARSELAAAARHERYADGEALVAEGEAGDSLFVVDRGEVEVAKASASLGASVILATLGAGDVFGEMSLLTGEPRSASVTARGGCEVFSLDRAALAPLLERDPAVAEALSRRLAERGAATEARVADAHDLAARRSVQAAESASLLRRIRAFFKLGA